MYFPIYSNRPGYWSSFECQSFGTSLDDGSASSLLSSSRGYGHQHPQVSALINIADGQRDLKLYPFGCNMDERICILWLLSYENEKHMITASESPWDVSSIETQFISSTTVHSNGQKTPKQTWVQPLLCFIFCCCLLTIVFCWRSYCYLRTHQFSSVNHPTSAQRNFELQLSYLLDQRDPTKCSASAIPTKWEESTNRGMIGQ